MGLQCWWGKNITMVGKWYILPARTNSMATHGYIIPARTRTTPMGPQGYIYLPGHLHCTLTQAYISFAWTTSRTLRDNTFSSRATSKTGLHYKPGPPPKQGYIICQGHLHQGEQNLPKLWSKLCNIILFVIPAVMPKMSMFCMLLNIYLFVVANFHNLIL